MTALEPAADFAAVPRRHVPNGWTAAKQRAFIAALAGSGSVTDAAARVGMSKTSAYNLRSAPGSAPFCAAWDAAVTRGIGTLRTLAFDRVVHGVPVPVWYHGKQIGEQRWYDNRLLARLLAIYDRAGGASAAPTAVGEARPEPLRTTKRRGEAFSPAEIAERVARSCEEQELRFAMAQIGRRQLAMGDDLADLIERWESGLYDLDEATKLRIRTSAGTQAEYERRVALAAAGGLSALPSGLNSGRTRLNAYREHERAMADAAPPPGNAA